MKQDDFYGAPANDLVDMEGSLFREPGPFDGSAVKVEAMTQVVGNILWRHKGRKSAITIAELTRMTGRDARTVKAIVADLILTHGLMVGGAREGDHAGYFIVCDAEDLKAAVGPFEEQIKTMSKRVDRLKDLAAARGIA